MSASTESTNEPVFRHKRSGFEFSVYQNRIEVIDKTGFGAVFSGGKRETILLRSVTDIGVDGRAHLTVTTKDGKRRRFLIGKDRQEAHDAIAVLL